MSNPHVKYLLIGGGVASSTAAQAIRQRDPNGSVLLVGLEVVRPYHRPPLSKDYLLRENRAVEDLFAAPLGWYDEQNVELRTGVRVVGLDAARQTAQLDNGQEVSFERALLAIGMSPRHLEVPGGDLPNIQYLRTVQDAERLHNLAHKALAEGRRHERGRGQVAVIGGGLLGVELSATLTRMGLEVALIHGQSHPWGKFAGEATGRFLARYLERRGVKVWTGHRPLRLEGDGRVQRVALDNQTSVECDFVVAAIGVSLNREILRGTPILHEKAILTDDHCRTNVPGIYAAGDCAAVFDPLFGKHRVMDHWDSAQTTGSLAGANMAGDDQAYSGVSGYQSVVFDLTLKAWGESRLVSRRLWRGAPGLESSGFVEIGIDADGRVCQVLAVGRGDEGEAMLAAQQATLRELVKRRLVVEGHEEMLKDPETRLESLLD